MKLRSDFKIAEMPRSHSYHNQEKERYPNISPRNILSAVDRKRIVPG
jgi:hypothetical protein